MDTDPIVIPGVGGPVVVTVPTFWGRPVITVGGLVAARTRGSRYALPARNGATVEALLRAGFAEFYPVIEVGGTRYRTGPKAPVALRLLAALPILLVPVGGALGGLVGACGLVVNVGVARTQLSSGAKAMAMLGVTVCAAVLWLAVVVSLRAALGQP